MPRVVLRAITPKRAQLLDPKVVKDEMRKEAVDDAKRQAINMAKATVRTWTHKPDFGSRFIATADQIGVDVFPQGANAKYWIWTTLGTRPHLIVPVRARALRFQRGFRPKTRRRVLGSGAGAKFGPMITARAVRHPGTEAREFEKEMAKRLRSRFRKRVENALRRAARR